MIWNIAYWALLVVSALVLLYALFWDRAGFRGRAGLRCRKCWYDLTANANEDDEDPARRAGPSGVVCPECGKGHRGRRSMRRTRRRWGLVGVALVVMLGADMVRSVPGIQQRGWVAAVPDSMLVLMIPFADGAPGSSFDQTMWGGGPVNQSVWDRLSREIRSAGWNKPPSWLADRLAFLLARFESRSVLTDSTSDRGTFFASRINNAIRLDRAFGFEERWARSVAYAEFHTRERLKPGATVYGELRIRRLVHGIYKADVGVNGAWFEARTRSNSVPLGGSFGSGPGVAEAADYVDLEQWDALDRVPRTAYGESSRGEMMVSQYQLDQAARGEQQRSVIVRIFDRLGEHRLSDAWREAGRLDVAYRFVADPDAGPEVLNDQQLASSIALQLSASLGLRFDRDEEKWVLVATVGGGRLALDQPITIGGEVTVELAQRDGQGVRCRRLLRGPKKWWRWEPPSRPPEGMSEQTPEYWELWTEGHLVPSGAEHRSAGDAHGIRFIEDGSFVRFRNDDGRLVLRIATGNHNQIVYADPKAERVLMGELVIPIRGWSVEELNRFRVSGVVPDHAMP